MRLNALRREELIPGKPYAADCTWFVPSGNITLRQWRRFSTIPSTHQVTTVLPEIFVFPPFTAGDLKASVMTLTVNEATPISPPTLH